MIHMLYRCRRRAATARAAPDRRPANCNIAIGKSEQKNVDQLLVRFAGAASHLDRDDGDQRAVCARLCSNNNTELQTRRRNKQRKPAFRPAWQHRNRIAPTPPNRPADNFFCASLRVSLVSNVSCESGRQGQKITLRSTSSEPQPTFAMPSSQMGQAKQTYCGCISDVVLC
jgi:hypothetical protein